MHRLVLSATFATALAVVLAVPAQGSFDPHFKVVTETVHHHGVGHGGDAFYEKVIDPRRPQNKVGWVKGGAGAFEGAEGTLTLAPSDLGRSYGLNIFHLD